MAEDTRPYVVPKMTDRGTIRLLIGGGPTDPMEGAIERLFDEYPGLRDHRDCVLALNEAFRNGVRHAQANADDRELDLLPRDAAQLAIQLLRTYGLTYGMMAYVGDGDHRAQVVAHTKNLDIDTNGRIVLHIPHDGVWNDYRGKVLLEVREALGIRR